MVCLSVEALGHMTQNVKRVTIHVHVKRVTIFSFSFLFFFHFFLLTQFFYLFHLTAGECVCSVVENNTLQYSLTLCIP